MNKMTPAQERRYVQDMAASIATTLFEQWLRPSDPTASDYPALAAEEPTGQVKDRRDSAEVMGCNSIS